VIRKSTINLNYGNSEKEKKLWEFITEYTRVVNFYIEVLWSKEIFSGTYLSQEYLAGSRELAKYPCQTMCRKTSTSNSKVSKKEEKKDNACF
jgi:hypothetical protein